MKLKTLFLASVFALTLTSCSNNSNNVDNTSNAENSNQSSAVVEETSSKEATTLRLTTTTSVNDSGLMEYLRDDLKKDTGLDMDIVSKGTGAAIEDAKAGNADAILVHSPSQEKDFIDEGYGMDRKPFMHNFFVIVGPKDDPAGIKGKSAEEAFKAIEESGEKFVSRGDESGTHNKEKSIWESAGVDLEEFEKNDNYNSLGDGMGATLTYASENKAYTLTDLSTFLSMKNDLDLEVLVNESDSLKNVYSVILVNPDKVDGVDTDAAKKFQEWMTGDKAAKLIEEYGKDEYGEQLFFLGE